MLRDEQVQRDRLAQLGPLGRPESLEQQVRQDPQGQQVGQLAPPAPLDLRVRLERLVLQGSREPVYQRLHTSTLLQIKQLQMLVQLSLTHHRLRGPSRIPLEPLQ